LPKAEKSDIMYLKRLEKAKISETGVAPVVSRENNGVNPFSFLSEILL